MWKKYSKFAARTLSANHQSQNNKMGDILYKVWRLYADGFRQMTVGRTLWALIIVKLIVIFVILRWLFFPDYVRTNAPQGQEAEFVAGEVLGK